MLDEAWALSPSVALRPEPFGALAYHFGNRRLTFLKNARARRGRPRSRRAPDVRGALNRRSVPESQWSAYLTAYAVSSIPTCSDPARRRPHR